MKKRLQALFSAILVLFLLSGCQSNEETGTIVGGIAGGLVASQIGKGSGQAVAIMTGTLLGGYFGRQVGMRLDRVDRMHMTQATNQALSQQQAYEWQTHNAHGVVRPASGRRARFNHDGLICRSFNSTVQFRGNTQWSTAEGCACRHRHNRHWIIKPQHLCKQHRRF